MSVLSDVLKGNWGNIGTDFAHAPSSLAAHPDELLATLGGAAAIAAPFAIPELGAALGLGGAAEAAAPIAAGATALPDAALSADTALGFAPDVAGGLNVGDAAALEPFSNAGSVAGATPGGFASTDAELTGGITGAGTSTPVSSSIIPSSIAGWFGNQNPLMLASLGLGAGNIARQFISPPKIPNQDQLNQLAQQGQNLAGSNTALQHQLTDPLLTGNLPADQEKQVQQGLQDAEQTIHARYASLGMAGSTAEQDAILNARNQAQVMKGQLEQQMAQIGMQAGSQAAADLNVSASIYNGIMQATMAQDTALSNAITNFAGQAGVAAAIGSRKAA